MSVSSKANSFLIVRLGAIGDALRTVPSVRRLRRDCPEATIAWAVEQWVHPVLEGNPNVDRFHVLDRRELRAGKMRALREVRRFVSDIRSYNYDVVLDFHGRLKSGVVTLCSGSSCRIGYARGQCTEANFLFTNKHVKLEHPLENRVLRFLELLSPLGIDTTYDPYDLGLSLASDVQAKAMLWYEQRGHPVLAAYPGSSKRQAGYHRWPKEKWIELLRGLGAEGITTVLFWGPDDEDFTREIAEKADTCCELSPKTTLCEMMAMLGQFRGFIGSNTAAMHMAWLQCVPTVVFSGPALAETDSPLRPVPFRVLRAGMYERPGKSKRYQPEVTGGVSVGEAKQSVQEILNSESEEDAEKITHH